MRTSNTPATLVAHGLFAPCLLYSDSPLRPLFVVMGNSKSAPKSVSRSRGRSTAPEYDDVAAAPPSNPNAILTTKLPELMQQTVMHWLEPKEMLKLARTSKQMGNTVSNAFAWKHTPPLRLQTPKLPSTPPPASRFLAYIPFALHWRDTKTSVAEDVARVLAVAKAVQFKELHLLCPESSAAAQNVQPLSEAQVASLFEQKAFQSLQEVSIKAPTAQLLRLICALPGVRTLSLSERLKFAEECAPLLTAPMLTNLAARDSYNERESSVASTAASVPQLRSLLLQWPCLYGRASFRSFCSGVAIPRLRELQLNSWQPMGDGAGGKLEAVPAEDLAAGFAKMLELQSLTLAECGDVTSVLQAVHAAPALRLLALRRDVKIGPADDAMAGLLSSRALLSSVLSSSPLLRLELFGHMNPSIEFRARKSKPANCEANWTTLNDLVASLSKEHQGRIRLLTN